jgi:hypothetical protein
MKRSSRMTIQHATQDYERWLAGYLEIVPEDLAAKHEKMAGAVFPFLRATYYRWAQMYPHVCKELGRAPQVLAVGDLHVENFGTWRDAEGRLVWGINDFDETCRLPYPHDLVRLATSAHLAIADGHLTITAKEACESILGGYREGLEASGRPFVLAEHDKSLREMATSRLNDPQKFWEKLDRLPTWKGEVPSRAAKALSNMLPRPDLPRRVVHRVAGLGSLGRQRFVAIADWQGGRIAREAKALAPSAALWAFGGEGSTKVLYQNILDQSVRSVDPWVKVRRRFIVRRLAPDCSRVELAELPEEREESRLLRAMGSETANVHLGSRSAHALLVDLAARDGEWLHHAAKAMLEAVQEDWEAWRTNPVEPAIKPSSAAVAAATSATPEGTSGSGGTVVPMQHPGGKTEDAGAAKPALGKKGRAEKVRKRGGGGEADAVVNAGKGKSAKGEKPGKGDKAGKGDKSGKTEKPGKGKPKKAGKGGKRVVAAEQDEAGKGAKAAKAAKPGKGAKAAKPTKKVKKAEDPAAQTGSAQANKGKQTAATGGAEAAASADDSGGAAEMGAKKAKPKVKSA